MRSLECPRCRADVPEEAAFCAACGRDLSARGGPDGRGRQSEGASPSEPATLTERVAVPRRLQTCAECGAANSPSRSRCGSCGQALDGSVDDLDDALRRPASPEHTAARGDDAGRRGILTAVLVVSIVGGVALGMVLLTELGTAGQGPPFDAAAYPAESRQLDVTGVGATSVQSTAAGAAAVVDGTVESAWIARQPDEQAVVLRLAAPAWVVAVEIGLPQPPAEGATPVTRLRLTGGDGEGALVRVAPEVRRQRARLTDPLLTDRVIVEVVETAGDGVPTIGEITLLGHPANATDAALVEEEEDG